MGLKKIRIASARRAIALLVKSLSANTNHELQEAAIDALCHRTDGDDSIISQIAGEAEAIFLLVKCLSADYSPDLQEAAAFVLNNLAAGCDLRTSEIASAPGAIALLVKRARLQKADENPRLQKAVVRALACLHQNSNCRGWSRNSSACQVVSRRGQSPLTESSSSGFK